MRSVLNGMDRVSQFLGLAVAHFYLVCALVTAYEVIMRYLFNAPTLWAFEVVMVTCASAWVLSGAYVTMRRGHIAITVLYQYTRGWARWYLDLFIQLVTLASMSVLLYALWEPMSSALRGGVERSGTSFNSPEPAVLKTMLFAGALLYALQTLANLMRHLQRSGRPARPDLEAE
jgi:TRAP-type mannitol/chloroaromatic compound transport system permease small subunit